MFYQCLVNVVKEFDYFSDCARYIVNRVHYFSASNLND